MELCFNINYVFLFLAINLNVCLTCNTFGDVMVEIHPKDGKSFNNSIRGCIEPSKFNDKPGLEVIQVKFLGQPINLLKKGTIQNLAKLKHVIFNYTDTVTIQPEAFRHLPRLISLFLIHSPIETIPNNVFQNLPSLNKLRLHHNNISEIENYAFGNIPSLKQIFIGFNKIGEWNSNWFTNSTSLEELDFQSNLLTKIPQDAFMGLGKLSKILLDNNKISEIENDAFQSLENLDYISIKYNCLKILSAETFPATINVNALYLDRNILNFITNELLEKVSLHEISLYGNPWKCPCLQRTLFWFYQKLGTSKLCGGCSPEQSGQPVCVYPTTYASTCLETIDVEATNTFLNLSGNADFLTKCT